MRRLMLIALLSIGLITATLTSPAAAAVSMNEDYLSLASRTYSTTGASVTHKDINAGAGKGYWLVASDGGVFAFGDAKFYGSVPGLNPPVQGSHLFVGITAAVDGNGYYLYDRNGYVYAFGSAKWYGSPAGWTQGRAVTALATTPTGNGYYMMDIRGSLWGYGDAAVNDVRNYIDYANEPWSEHGRVQLSATSIQNAYAMALDGTVIPGYYNEDAGSYGQKTNADFPMTAFATTSAGYYEAALDGSVFAYGNATFHGSLPQYVSARDLVAPIIGMQISGPNS